MKPAAEDEPATPVATDDTGKNPEGKTSWLASRLRRITTSGSYVPEIDGLRFVAIASVVLYHISIQTKGEGGQATDGNVFWTAVSHGYRGVPLFFAISGFILGMPFAAHMLQSKAPVRLKSYFLRRVTRLEPPYILMMLIRAVLLIWLMHKSLWLVTPSLVASLFYLHNLVFAEVSLINPPAWSLEVEIQFYFLAPIIAWCYFKGRAPIRRRAFASAAILAGCFARNYLAAISPRMEMSILCNFQYFLAGFLLVDLYLSDWKKIPRHFVWDLVSLICWSWIFIDKEARVHLFFPLAIVVAFVAAFKGPVFSWIFRLTWVTLLGGMCYSIYLTHNLAITLVDSGLKRMPHLSSMGTLEESALAYLTSLVAATGLGLLLFVAVERPCMDKRWPAKVLQALKGKPYTEKAAW